MTKALHICIIAGVMSLAACRPYEAAWRSTAGVQAAASIADKAIASAAIAAHDKCKHAHGVANDAYRKCMDDARGYKALVQWRKWAKPAINSALISTVTSLQIAERAKVSKLKWLDILKPAACAIAKVVEQFGDMLGKQKALVMAAIGFVKGVACEPAK